MRALLETLEARLLMTATAYAVDLNLFVASSDAASYSLAGGLTVAQVRGAYGVNAISFGGDGSGQTIAIVVAYRDQYIWSDLQAFDNGSNGFGLPNPPSFHEFGGSATEAPPAYSTETADWASETAMDVEWAHAIAPGANIDLVEAPADDLGTLLTAAEYAATLPGVSVVSMSFGSKGPEPDAAFESAFRKRPCHASRPLPGDVRRGER